MSEDTKYEDAAEEVAGTITRATQSVTTQTKRFGRWADTKGKTASHDVKVAALGRMAARKLKSQARKSLGEQALGEIQSEKHEAKMEAQSEDE